MRAGIVYVKIPIDMIHSEYTSDDVSLLKESIRVYGLLQPIGVTKNRCGYRLIFGARRLKACRELDMKYIHAVLLSYREDEIKLINAVENIHRANKPYLTYYADRLKGSDIKKLLCLDDKSDDIARYYFQLDEISKSNINESTVKFIPESKGDNKYFMRMCQLESTIPSLAKEKVRLSVLSDKRIFINEIEKIITLMRIGGYGDCFTEDDTSITIKKTS